MHTPTGREAIDDDNLLLTVAPEQGHLAAYERVYLDATFAPVAPTKLIGWNHDVCTQLGSLVSASLIDTLI